MNTLKESVEDHSLDPEFQKLRSQKMKECNLFIENLKSEKHVPHKTQIIILGTGGTFQSGQTEEGGLAPTGKLAESLKALQLPSDGNVEMYDGDNESRLFELFAEDSANMEVWQWSIIAEAIARILIELPHHVDGIIVTHGTDTMARMASYMSYMLQNVPKPVIITGSQRPARMKGTDAGEKMKNSIWTIQKAKEVGMAEVGVLCGNTLVRGAWAEKIGDETDNAFVPFNDPKYEAIVSHEQERGRVIVPQLLDFTLPEGRRSFLPHARSYNPNKPFTINPIIPHHADIIFIPTTDISNEYLQAIIKPTKIGVFELLGSATANDRVVDIIEEFKEKGKIILFRSPFHDSSTRAGHYSAGAKVSRMNVPILNTSPDSLRAKINFVRHKLELDKHREENDDIGFIYPKKLIQDFNWHMATNMVGELIE